MLASAAESREELTSGTSYSPPPAFGRFKLLHQIGAGVLGPVFRTHDPEHERLVVVKAFTLDLTPEQASSLAAEFGRLAALEIDAPCVAAPLAAGIEELVPFVAVPYVPGESLDAAIRQYGPAPAGDAIRLIAHVADALDAAAHAGVHHGSLHPRDIIVTPGETHVTGLGVAQALERVGLHGPVRRPYVAPERESGDEWSAPADVYALAAIAYEVLTGRRALPGTDQPLPALKDLHVHDAASLREVLEAALDADPGRRPARARDFATAFAGALSESAGAPAPGERTPDRRARKPRTRPPKLPGLDEPLAPPEASVKGRARAASLIVPVPEASDTQPAPSATLKPEKTDVADVILPQPASATGEIRYVPVTDPADAGETVQELAAPVPSSAEVRPESDAAFPADTALHAAFEPPSANLASGFTPDLRLVDELLPRTDASGETVDAELAAALDRLASDHGAGPTPAIIGLDILGPGPSADAAAEDAAGFGIGLDLAAETQLGYTVAEEKIAPTRQAPSAPEAEGMAATGDLGPDVGAFDRPIAQAEERVATPPDAGVADASAPPADLSTEPVSEPGSGELTSPATEPLRPFARGRGSERRRTPSRYGRVDVTPAVPDAPGEGGAAVPRVFGQARPTPASRPVQDFELLTRAESGRRPLLPLFAGVAGGLIIGLAAGYWLGTRSAAPSAAPPAQTVTSGQPASDPAPPSGTAPLAAAKPSMPGEAAPGVQAGSASTGPAATQPAAAAPPAASPSPSRPLAAVHGAIEVTATEQANVFVDGERKGMTPRNLTNVPLGSHTIRVTRPGYEPQEQVVVLTAEEPTASMKFTLRRGSAGPSAGGAQAPAVKSVLTVVIESQPPGARIRIDGRDLAPAPLTVRQLRPGTHTLELRLPGYKTWSQRLTVAAGDNRRISATLERDNTR
jgi:serine/threonine-protein kinase